MLPEPARQRIRKEIRCSPHQSVVETPSGVAKSIRSSAVGVSHALGGEGCSNSLLRIRIRQENRDGNRSPAATDNGHRTAA